MKLFITILIGTASVAEDIKFKWFKIFEWWKEPQHKQLVWVNLRLYIFWSLPIKLRFHSQSSFRLIQSATRTDSWITYDKQDFQYIITFIHYNVLYAYLSLYSLLILEISETKTCVTRGINNKRSKILS